MIRNYKQFDPAWASLPYAGGTMANSGCGPTSCADLTGESPADVAAWMTANNGASQGSGTYHSAIYRYLISQGYESQQITGSSQAGSMDNAYFKIFRESIQAGNCGILLMGGINTGCINSFWTTDGHYIAVVGFENDQYLVHDPASYSRDGWHDWQDFAGDIKHCFISNVRFRPDTGIKVDGFWGYETSKAAQTVYGTTIDGIVSNQNKSMIPYLPNCEPGSWEFVDKKKMKRGSELIKAIQRQLGIAIDGFMGMETITNLQRFLSVSIDGYIGSETVSAFQRYLNSRL